MNKIILASNSQRRATLLELAELPFVVMPSYASEDYDPSDPPEKIVKQLAERKAAATFQKTEKKEKLFIIGADTIVVSDGEILNKPHNYKEAFAMLQKLSGKTHEVITGICILTSKEKSLFYETTLVTFSELDDDLINYYIEKHHPFDKAGAYAIQEWIGAIGISEIKGDYYNVMGLPVHRLVSALNKMGYSLPYSI